MGKIEKEGIGLVCHDYEEDYLELGDSYEDWFGITGLVEEAAGIEAPPASDQSGFEYDGQPYDGGYWHQTVVDYRRESGREWPPVYRVKITVEAEALSDEECAAWWERRRTPPPPAPDREAGA